MDVLLHAGPYRSGLFKAVELIQDRLLAWLVVIVYMAAPLGIYFSRAVHIDSAALCFGHALLYYFLRFGDTGRRLDLACAFVASALGFLVKAPYVFYLILPALFVQLVRRQPRRAAASVLVFGAALAVGLAWYFYAQSVNARAPDLSFVRGSEAVTYRVDFYVGQASQRLSPERWQTIGARIRHEIASDYWWPLPLLALS